MFSLFLFKIASILTGGGDNCNLTKMILNFMKKSLTYVSELTTGRSLRVIKLFPIIFHNFFPCQKRARHKKPCHKRHKPDVAGTVFPEPRRSLYAKYCLLDYTKLGGAKFVLSSVYYIVQPFVSYPLVSESVCKDNTFGVNSKIK